MATNILNSIPYRSERYISDDYKIMRFARLLAGYDDETWNKLKRARKLTYVRAASNLLHAWQEFEAEKSSWKVSIE